MFPNNEKNLAAEIEQSRGSGISEHVGNWPQRDKGSREIVILTAALRVPVSFLENYLINKYGTVCWKLMCWKMISSVTSFVRELRLISLCHTIYVRTKLCFCVKSFLSSPLYYSVLSRCSHAALALLYPFTWQHTFVPVLPASMLDISCSPTPFLIGVLAPCLPQLLELPIEEVSLNFVKMFKNHCPICSLNQFPCLCSGFSDMFLAIYSLQMDPESLRPPQYSSLWNNLNRL